VGAPRVDAKAAFAPHARQVATIEDFKQETKTRFKLGLPLLQHRGRHRDHDGLDLLAQQQLARDQARLDGLAEPGVVGDEEVDAWQAERLAQGLHLVGVEFDAGAERGLEEVRVGRGDAVPAQRVEKGPEEARRVEALGGETAPTFFLQNPPVGLVVPEHVEGLALGVVVGDVIWPLLAILGVTWIVSVYAGFMEALRWVACLTFLAMGALLIRNAGKSIASDSRLTRPGLWAGFGAGVAVILGNPKAILFYMGVLPGFFDLTRLTALDIAAICLLSLVVPLIGNLSLAVFLDRARRLLTSPTALRRTNIVSGVLLIGVGLVIPLT